MSANEYILLLNYIKLDILYTYITILVKISKDF